ncbi:hypothetical protein K450DRAFT_267406 [Umbelopsis ramanniana AG]|uniref:SWIRM domain-containing protein n=1 Tax=Umbelopsis ramanniana AG TaxID=1314678 RepID=A0AAD5EKA1_UMBRA|nr:uncharacterized protein K450DRAFT_267406 [Umbelopsis ramanniana AG]KAI8584750.1 hypothetical protein K450DRAFT_267406 [Umbelopsis ramanniana AG]
MSPPSISETNDMLLLSPPLTPTDRMDKSCPWKQANTTSWMSYQNCSTKHDSNRTNRMAHDQQHDHPVAPVVIKKLQSDRTKRNKSFIQSYRRYHPMQPSFTSTQMAPPPKRCVRKSTKAYRSPAIDNNSLNIFALDIYESLLREPHQLVRSVIPSPPQPKLTTTVTNDSADTAQPLTRKEKSQLANAASYDAMDIENDESTVFSHEWIPNLDALDHKHIKIVWKGAPLKISHLPMYNKLHATEATIASTLRLTPVQYIRCKRTLIRAASEYERHGTPFRKSDAQKLCRVDVNKTSSLWSIFGELGWLGQTWPN